MSNLLPEAQPLHVVALHPAVQVAILDENQATHVMFTPNALCSIKHRNTGNIHEPSPPI